MVVIARHGPKIRVDCMGFHLQLCHRTIHFDRTLATSEDFSTGE
jgi:hypothetical protein